MNPQRLVLLLLAFSLTWLCPEKSSGQCKSWNYSFSPEIRCDYQEFFNLPTRATLICKPRLVSSKSPGDYYQEPNPYEFGGVKRTTTDNEHIRDYIQIFFKDECICRSAENYFNSYIVFVDTSMEHGHNPEHASFADSSRREFFGKFLLDEHLIFMSGWFDKFVCLYINVETDSVQNAVAVANSYLKTAIPPLTDFNKYEYEIRRSDVRKAVGSSTQTPVLDINHDTFYRHIDSSNTAINIFKRVVAIMPESLEGGQSILNTRSFWVVGINHFWDSNYLPSWAERK